MAKTPTKKDEIVLSAHNITKTYGQNIHALRGVNFDVRQSKVTTLFGENGAGKSTLMKILSGIETHTSGEIHLYGENVTFPSASHAQEQGISIIHQELSLAPNLSVRDNIFLGRELLTLTGAVDYEEENRQTRKLMEILEEDIDPETLVEDLRLGKQQIVEIARALSVDSKILIMDEPTSALSATEVEVLFKVIKDLNAKGVSIIYISHHLEEALQVTDYAVVIRDGLVTGTGKRKDIDLKWIVQHMVGDDYNLGKPPADPSANDVRLAIKDVTVNQLGTDVPLVDNLSLDVKAGEIICLYGLMGAGRTELLEAVAGGMPMAGGHIHLDGTDISHMSIIERIEKGLVLVPEDRQRDGLVQTMSIGRNLSLASMPVFSKFKFLLPTKEQNVIDSAVDNVNVKTNNPDNAIGSLSGGNQQKVVIGKMLATEPKVIVLDEPSRGIDIGAKAEIFALLAQGAEKGLSVIYSTSEVSECLSIAHRIIVLHRGQISAIFGSDASKEQIMAASGEAKKQVS